MTADADLVVHVARFAGALRARGVEVGVGDEIDATRALTLVDVGDRDEVRIALRTALKIRRRHWTVFDEVYRHVWTGMPDASRPPARTARPRPGPGALRPWSGPPRWDPWTASPPAAGADGEAPGYSPEMLLRRKPFEECSPADLAAMEHVLARLAPRLATRRSRRLVPVSGRGVVHLRRSFRRAVAAGGELLPLPCRARAIDEPDLLVLCDTSGSMGPQTRFLITFILSLKRVARRTEVFSFNTSLTRLTPWLVPAKAGRTLEQLAAGVPDWAGGTKIGESLADFVARFGTELVTARTVVLIFSDGLDRGDTALVADAMRAIHARARRVIWLNPLCGDARYEPTARAMQAALPFIDRLAPAHDLASLERLLPELRA